MLYDIKPRFFQPHLPPLVNSNPIRSLIMLLHAVQQVLQFCIPELVGPEVLLEGSRECLLAHQVHQLFHSGRALGIRDPIEYGLSYLGVGHIGAYGVRGDKLILRVPPALAIQK